MYFTNVYVYAIYHLTSPDAIKNRWTEYASELYRKQQQCDYEMIADLKRRSCDEDETDMNNNILMIGKWQQQSRS